MRLALALSLAFVLAASNGSATPKIDLNTASAQSLEELPGIGVATARRIIRIRERNGPFRCVEELRAVPRLTESQYQTLERSLEVRAGADCRRFEERRRAGQPIHR